MNQELLSCNTLGELKKSGYVTKTVKEELRHNLIHKLRHREPLFKGVLGYENTVLPEIERAILSGHNIILLGLRGQAKTRIARLMTELLDDYIPIISGSEVNDDPFLPISRYGIDLLAQKGDDTPISWVPRSERYAEKLATPDVSVADLIGDIDPIKAANLRLSYADERVLHFGIIPRSNRCIFVINELPDLQARIQVALFNILQEGDVQIRGFKVRIPLDIQLVFTANPEDYTNRGSIVTPLKDRIESQILTHYPKTRDISREITLQEAKVKSDQKRRVSYSKLILDLNEQIAIEARKSEFVDAKSGVSARLTISSFQHLISSAERRAILNNEEETHVRISDFYSIVPAITGKIELVYEGEQEGPLMVAKNLLSKAIRSLFLEYFPNPEKLKKKKQASDYQRIQEWFATGNTVDIGHDSTNREYVSSLARVNGLDEIVEKCIPKTDGSEKLLFMEFVLYALSEYSLLGRQLLESSTQFKDLFNSVFSSPEDFNIDDLENQN